MPRGRRSFRRRRFGPLLRHIFQCRHLGTSSPSIHSASRAETPINPVSRLIGRLVRSTIYLPPWLVSLLRPADTERTGDLAREERGVASDWDMPIDRPMPLARYRGRRHNNHDRDRNRRAQAHPNRRRHRSDSPLGAVNRIAFHTLTLRGCVQLVFAEGRRAGVARGGFGVHHQEVSSLGCSAAQDSVDARIEAGV